MRTWLKELRNCKQLSTYEVAKRAGISQSYYSGIEQGIRGKKSLNVKVAKAIAKVLDFDWTEFFK